MPGGKATSHRGPQRLDDLSRAATSLQAEHYRHPQWASQSAFRGENPCPDPARRRYVEELEQSHKRPGPRSRHSNDRPRGQVHLTPGCVHQRHKGTRALRHVLPEEAAACLGRFVSPRGQDEGGLTG